MAGNIFIRLKELLLVKTKNIRKPTQMTIALSEMSLSLSCFIDTCHIVFRESI